MKSRSRRSRDDSIEDVIKVGGEAVPARVDVDGGTKGFDVNRLLNPSFDPIMLRGQDGNILFAKVVVIFASMLQHCRLVLPKSIGGSLGVLLEAGSCSSFCFSYISAWARCRINASARYVVNVANSLFLFDLVLGFDKRFT